MYNNEYYPESVNLISRAEAIYFVSTKRTFFEDYATKCMLEDKSTVWNIEYIYNYNDPQLLHIVTNLLI